MHNLTRFRDFLNLHMRWFPLTPAGVVRAIVLGTIANRWMRDNQHSCKGP